MSGQLRKKAASVNVSLSDVIRLDGLGKRMTNAGARVVDLAAAVVHAVVVGGRARAFVLSQKTQLGALGSFVAIAGDAHGGIITVFDQILNVKRCGGIGQQIDRSGVAQFSAILSELSGLTRRFGRFLRGIGFFWVQVVRSQANLAEGVGLYAGNVIEGTTIGEIGGCRLLVARLFVHETNQRRRYDTPLCRGVFTRFGRRRTLRSRLCGFVTLFLTSNILLGQRRRRIVHANVVIIVNGIIIIIILGLR